ncbi:MAG: M14 family metallopeptidase [Planctomycetota bacterium]
MSIASLALTAIAVVAQEPVLPPFEPIRLGDDAANTWSKPFFPDARYDAAVAHPRDVLGQPVGSRLASHAEVLAMLRAIAATSDRATIEPYGVTYEGRELVTLTITSPKNHARLDEIRATARRMWDPRGGEVDLSAQPGVAWMGYGIHGDETSATEAAVPVAYHLAACLDDEVVAALEDVVIVLDPCLNPDGRERIRSMVVQSAGRRANLDAGSMQRGRWPGGRGNHYLFDMNRDWMAGEAPETRARWARLLELPPQLFVDAHEMSGLDTFLFYPQAPPRNPNLPERLLYWQGVLADDAAAEFDRYGWGYYTREWADALAPFYSDAWGSLTGAIGMLYEQGRTIGAPLERESGEIVPYRETVHGQVVVSMANVLSFARNREAILTDYVAHRRASCEPSGAFEGRAYVVAPTADVERDAHFMRTMRRQGIEVLRARDAFEASDVVSALGERSESVAFPAGAWIVPAAQPQGAMMRAYLDFDPRLDADFLREERESIERGRGSKTYDATAWDLGRQFGVDAYWAAMPSVATDPAGPVTAPVGPVGDVSGAYAWALDGDDGRSLRFAARAMELGLSVHVSDKAFEARVRDADGNPETATFPRGSLLLRRHENPDGVDELVAQAADETRAVVRSVVSGRAVGDGPDLGGGHFMLLKRPRVAILSNSPVSRTDFGHAWRAIDEGLGLPVTLVDAQGYRGVDLDDYNVLVLPSGASSFVRDRAGSLRDWVRSGGVLVAIGSTAVALADPEVELSGNRLRRDVLGELDVYAWRASNERAAHAVEVDVDLVYGDDAEEPEAPSETEVDDEVDDDSSDDASPDVELEDEWRRRFSPAGVILRGELDPESWITAGRGEGEIPVYFGGSSALMPAVRPAVRLASEPRLRLAGLLWPEARARIADSAWLTVESRGRGLVVSFASSPIFRGSWRSTLRLFENAIVIGPGMTR